MPRPLRTDTNKPLLDDPARYNAFVSKIPLGRWGNLPEIAGPAVFLASEAASFITGTALFRGRGVDGAVRVRG